jgi:hypothetical protein
MFLSRMILSRLPLVGGLAAAVVALLLAAGPAVAQPPPGASKLWPWNLNGALVGSTRSLAAAPAPRSRTTMVPGSVDVTTTGSPCSLSGGRWRRARLVVGVVVLVVEVVYAPG